MLIRPLFTKYQKQILDFANSDYGKRHLGIDTDKKIVKFTPDSYHELLGIKDGVATLKATFFSKSPFIKRFELPLTALEIAREANVYPKQLIKRPTDFVNHPYLYFQELAGTSLLSDGNLQAYYKFETGALTTDSSSNARTLTNNGTVGETTGKYGIAADFGSSNSSKYFSKNTALGLTWHGAKSISCWFKISAQIASGTWSIFELFTTNTSGEHGIVYDYNGGTRRLRWVRYKQVTVESTDAVNYNITLSTDTWYHIVCTYDGTTMQMYLNGLLVGSASSTANASAGTGVYTDSVAIGSTGTSGYLSGVVDDLAVFNRLLTIEEVETLYYASGTSAFHPDAHPESTSVDGVAGINVSKTTWSAVHDGAGNQSQDFESSTGTFPFIDLVCDNDSGAPVWQQCHRAFFLFDTSSLTSSANISAATFSNYFMSGGGTALSQSIGVVGTTPASNTAIVNSDYAQTGTTRYATDQVHVDIDDNAYHDFSLNATGIAAVSKTAVTKLGLRMSSDIDNSEPSPVSYGARLYMHFADDSSNKPKLVVTYTVATGGSLFFNQL